MAKYIAIKELHAATQVSKNLYILDFLFIIVYLVVSIAFRGFVVSELQVLYFIFNALVAIKLVSRTQTNPGKHFYQALFLWYKKDSSLYYSITNISKDKLRRKMKNEIEKQKE